MTALEGHAATTGCVRMTCDVVIVSYRSGSVLDASLETASSLAQGGRVIVVDNDASDVEVARAAAARGASLISNSRNVGFAAAVNQGVAASDADILVLLNPDVARIDGDVAAVLRSFYDDGSVAAVGVRLVNPDGTVQPSCRTEPAIIDFVAETLALGRRLPRWRRGRRFRMLDWAYDEPAIVDCASGACLFIRRSSFDALGGLDERFFVYTEELDFLVRAKRAGWKTVFTPEVSAVHVGGGSSDASRDYLSLLLLASWYQYANKHFGRPRRIALRLSLFSVDVLRLAAAHARGRSTTSRPALRQRIAIHVGSRAWPDPDMVQTLGREG